MSTYTRTLTKRPAPGVTTTCTVTCEGPSDAATKAHREAVAAALAALPGAVVDEGKVIASDEGGEDEGISWPQRTVTQTLAVTGVVRRERPPFEVEPDYV